MRVLAIPNIRNIFTYIFSKRTLPVPSAFPSILIYFEAWLQSLKGYKAPSWQPVSLD